MLLLDLAAVSGRGGIKANRQTGLGGKRVGFKMKNLRSGRIYGAYSFPLEHAPFLF